MSTQEAFGKILNEIGKGDTELAERIVTTSPDVTVSTNLGGWVNRRGIFNRAGIIVNLPNFLFISSIVLSKIY